MIEEGGRGKREEWEGEGWKGSDGAMEYKPQREGVIEGIEEEREDPEGAARVDEGDRRGTGERGGGGGRLVERKKGER